MITTNNHLLISPTLKQMEGEGLLGGGKGAGGKLQAYALHPLPFLFPYIDAHLLFVYLFEHHIQIHSQSIHCHNYITHKEQQRRPSIKANGISML
jgi:hypothetical protein